MQVQGTLSSPPHPKPNPSVTWHQVHEASASERQHPTPPRPNPEKRALDEKKEEKQQIPMVGGHTRTRAERHPEGTTRGPFFFAQFLSSSILRTNDHNNVILSQITWIPRCKNDSPLRSSK